MDPPTVGNADANRMRTLNVLKQALQTEKKAESNSVAKAMAVLEAKMQSGGDDGGVSGGRGSSLRRSGPVSRSAADAFRRTTQSRHPPAGRGGKQLEKRVKICCFDNVGVDGIGITLVDRDPCSSAAEKLSRTRSLDRSTQSPRLYQNLVPADRSSVHAYENVSRASPVPNARGSADGSGEGCGGTAAAAAAGHHEDIRNVIGSQGVKKVRENSQAMCLFCRFSILCEFCGDEWVDKSATFTINFFPSQFLSCSGECCLRSGSVSWKKFRISPFCSLAFSFFEMSNVAYAC